MVKTGMLALMVMVSSAETVPIVSTVEKTEVKEPINGDWLVRLVQKYAGAEVTLSGRVMQWTVEDVEMVCIFDEASDRMRIVSPIVEVSSLDPKELYTLLEANFHSALDARYSVSNGIVFSTYIHPLSALNEKQLASAISQVKELNKTYGTTYSSGALQYGGRESSSASEEGTI